MNKSADFIPVSMAFHYFVIFLHLLLSRTNEIQLQFDPVPFTINPTNSTNFTWIFPSHRVLAVRNSFRADVGHRRQQKKKKQKQKKKTHTKKEREPKEEEESTTRAATTTITLTTTTTTTTTTK